MGIRAKGRARSSTKVKRLSFHKYKEREADKPGVKRLGWGAKQAKPVKKAAKKIPPRQTNQPKYAPANPPPQNPPVQPVQVPAKPVGSFFLTLFIVIIIVLFVFTAWKLMTIDDDWDDENNRGSGCQVSCRPGDRAIIIAAQCNCPAGSRYYNTISDGMKQCIC